jgi:hypothetical protein
MEIMEDKMKILDKKCELISRFKPDSIDIDFTKNPNYDRFVIILGYGNLSFYVECLAERNFGKEGQDYYIHKIRINDATFDLTSHEFASILFKGIDGDNIKIEICSKEKDIIISKTESAYKIFSILETEARE